MSRSGNVPSPAGNSSPLTATASQRLDKWLWFARFCKSRSLAQSWIEDGKVALNGAIIRKTAALVRPGDVVDLDAGRLGRAVSVLAPGERRGPASEAQMLYVELGGSTVFCPESDSAPAGGVVLAC